jgi:hypothetical protein
VEAWFSRLCAGEVIVVGLEEFVNGDRLVAAGAGAADADSGAGPGAVGAPLLAEVALVALGAGVDGDLPSMPQWWGGGTALASVVAI